MLQTKSYELATYAQGDENSAKLALVLPGKLDSKDYAHIRSHVDYLATLGFYALTFDPPGTWASPGDLDLYTIPNYLQSITEVIELFGNKPTLVVGHSRGGSMAMLAGAKNPHIAGVVAIMSQYGPSSPSPEAEQDGYLLSYRDMPPGATRTAEQKEFKLPANFFIEGNDLFNINDLKGVTIPKLLIVGSQDTIIKSESIQATFEAYADPKELQTIDAVHDYRLQPEAVLAVNNLISNFVTHYGL